MKKALSVILSVILAFTYLSVIAFAEEETVDYLVLGDSIAYGSGLSNPSDAVYGKIVADTNGYNYTNYSVPGHTTANLISRLSNENVLQGLKEAEIISISIGGNNFLLSNLVGLMFDGIVKSDYSKMDEIAEGFYTDFCKIMDIINENNPDAVVLMQTLYNPQSGTLREIYGEGQKRLNEMVAKYDAEHPDEIIIVEVGAALGDDMDNFAADDIHPSAKGNEIIAVKVLEAIANAGLSEYKDPVITTPGEDFGAGFSFFFLDFFVKIFQFFGKIYNFFVNLF
ncbi:MAG: SGNH/GDSL hydrolase family protein [Clostridia bacterium]|nr:SGNH/GDSL hydrolase family protein [Clostridia bacterium]